MGGIKKWVGLSSTGDNGLVLDNVKCRVEITCIIEVSVVVSSGWHMIITEEDVYFIFWFTSNGYGFIHPIIGLEGLILVKNQHASTK